jgi:16S rRNA (cytosine967-C5)-methyltransferase
VRPAARLQMAIEILEALAGTDQPLDRFLRDWFRSRRFAGSKDRAAITERVFDIARHRASYAWRMGTDTSRALVIASLLKDGETPDAYFCGEGYGPSALDDAERLAIATPPIGEAPLPVQGEFPALLEPELARAFGADLLAEMQALQARAPVDLRVNTLKRSRDQVLQELHSSGLAAEASPFSPIGIRLASATAALGASKLFESGAFEFQDEAAQIAALLCAAKPGENILDIAAGAGGKSLALAAEMQNQGEIVASDIRQTALQQLAMRASRAGAGIIRTHLSNPDPPEGTFDAVLVDAPCSGTGTWRRQPELRWRLTPEKLAAYISTQDRLLEEAATRVRDGGRLIYATCSLLLCENEDRIEAFLSRHTEFDTRPCAELWRESVDTAVPSGMARFFKASPRTTGTEGFFAATLLRWTSKGGNQ